MSKTPETYEEFAQRYRIERAARYRYRTPRAEDDADLEHDTERAWTEALERRREAAARRLSAFQKGLPARPFEVARAGKPTPAIDRILEWHERSQRDGGIAVLSGHPGCGKTVAACAWGWQLDQPPLFLRCADFAAGGRYDREARQERRDARDLILDDIGAEYTDAKGSFIVDLDDLVDQIYSSKGRAVFTTNLGKPAFKDRYGVRVYDRLHECGEFIAIAGGSLRTGARP